MAWEYVTHACGHEVRHQYYGKTRDRKWQMQRDAQKLCEECYRAQLEKERAAENEAAAAAAQEQGLPALQGTPKQIAWAETIRAKGLTALDRAASEIAEQVKIDVAEGRVSPEAVDAVQLACDAVIGGWVALTDAGAWIDARFMLERAGRDGFRSEPPRAMIDAARAAWQLHRIGGPA